MDKNMEDKNKGKLDSKPKGKPPVRELLINKAIEESRRELISGQLELKFLESYIETIDSAAKKPNSEFVPPTSWLDRANIVENTKILMEKNQYELARMQFYKALRQQSIDAKSMKAYANAPDKLAIDESGSVSIR